MNKAATPPDPDAVDLRATHDVEALLGPDRLALREEVAALKLPPGTYYRDKTGEVHEVEFQRTPSVFLEGKSNLKTMPERGEDGKWKIVPANYPITRLRRPKVDVVQMNGGLKGGVGVWGLFAARGKYVIRTVGGDRDECHRVLMWDDNILDYWKGNISGSKRDYTTEILDNPLDEQAWLADISHLTVRTPHTVFGGRYSLARILSILAVMEEASGLWSGPDNDISILPYKYHDVSIRISADGFIPLDARPPGVVGTASFYIGGPRPPQQYFVL